MGKLQLDFWGKFWIDDKNIRDYTIEKQSPLEGFHQAMAESPSTSSWLAEILELRKGVIIWDT